MPETLRAAEASAPTRVDLAGGTLDIWPLYLLVDGAVTVNAAISPRARARTVPRGGDTHMAIAEDLSRSVPVAWPEPREAHRDRGEPPALPLHVAALRLFALPGAVELVTHSGVPAGSGLGGSSALAISMLAVLLASEGEEIDPEALVRAARDLEADVLEVPTGTQDHLAAVYGGVGAVQYGPGLRRRTPLPVDIEEFEAAGTLAYLGSSRISGRANWDMVRRAIDGDPATRRGLSAVAAIASEVRLALGRGQLDECARLLAEEWKERRGLSPQVSTPQTESALEAAARAGARGGKICGAGGGGCVFVMGPADASPAIRSALSSAGCTVMDFRVEREGLRVSLQG